MFLKIKMKKVQFFLKKRIELNLFFSTLFT